MSRTTSPQPQVLPRSSLERGLDDDVAIARHRLRLTQARTAWVFVGAGVGLVALGIAAFALEPAIGDQAASGLGILSTVFGGMMIFVALLIGLMTISWQRAVHRMAADAATTRWTYEPDLWARHLDREKHRGRWLPRIAAGGGVGMAILFWVIAWSEEGALDALALVMGGYFALLGIGCGLVASWHAARVHDQRLRDGGVALIGGQGAYISGVYWPWNTFGQHLESARLDGPADDFELSTLVLTFRVQTKHGSTTKEVHVPVPAGREEEAEDIVARFA